MVGINTLILSQGGGNEGLGFAAPSNIVRSVYDQLKAHGRVRRGTIGALVQSITPVLAEALQLPQDSGALVADVDADGPGAQAAACASATSSWRSTASRSRTAGSST